MNAARNRVITELRERIASMESPASRKAGALPFQVAEVDAALPGQTMKLITRARGALEPLQARFVEELRQAIAALSK